MSCPSWCQLWHGHETDHAALGAKVSIAGEDGHQQPVRLIVAAAADDGSETPALGAQILDLEKLDRLSAGDLRRLADAFLETAVRMDAILAERPTRHLRVCR